MGKQRIRLASRQVILVSPDIVRMLGGNVQYAYFFGQLCYYSKHQASKDGWVTKNSDEIENDTTLNRLQQYRARKLLESKGMIETISVRGGYKSAIKFRIVRDYLY